MGLGLHNLNSDGSQGNAGQKKTERVVTLTLILFYISHTTNSESDVVHLPVSVNVLLSWIRVIHLSISRSGYLRWCHFDCNESALLHTQHLSSECL